jgi:hypothetical protein
MFDGIALLISNLDVSSIYRSSGAIAKVLSVSLSPVLLIIAIYIRILRDSLDTFSSNSSGMWSRAVRDFVMWGIVLALYFGFGNLIINFANDIYRWADEIGGLKLLTSDMSAASKVIDAKLKAQSMGSSFLTGLATGAGTLSFITGLFYYLSLLIVAFLVAALKIAHALIFGFAFIWGLIAIPLSVSQSIKLLRGWALLLGFALLWPLVQALLIALIRPTMIGALLMISNADANAGVEMMSADLIMTVLNLLFAATVIAAPYLTSALVNNSPAAATMVTPFVSAALAGVAAAAGGAQGSAKMARQYLGQEPKSLLKTASSAARGSFGGDSAGSSPRPAAEVASPGATVSPSAAASSSPDVAEAAKRQQRRGVILSQNKSRKT